MYLTRPKVGDSADYQYGRRIETDRSWTVYHVFTGVPADPDAGATTGLNRAEATARMTSLNTRDEGQTHHRSAIAPALSCHDIETVV